MYMLGIIWSRCWLRECAVALFSFITWLTVQSNGSSSTILSWHLILPDSYHWQRKVPNQLFELHTVVILATKLLNVVSFRLQSLKMKGGHRMPTGSFWQGLYCQKNSKMISGILYLSDGCYCFWKTVNTTLPKHLEMNSAMLWVVEQNIIIKALMKYTVSLIDLCWNTKSFSLYIAIWKLQTTYNYVKRIIIIKLYLYFILQMNDISLLTWFELNNKCTHTLHILMTFKTCISSFIFSC